MTPLHFCDACGNVLKLATPILGYCPGCETVCPVNDSPPVPVHVHQSPPQPPPAHQETDELGSETECRECGGLEKKVTPIMAVCGVCGTLRSLVKKLVRDLAREQTVLRELIMVEQQLRTRGLPRTVREELVKRYGSLKAEKGRFDGRRFNRQDVVLGALLVGTPVPEDVIDVILASEGLPNDPFDWEVLPPGTTGQVLTVNADGSLGWAAGGGGGGGSGTVTSVSFTGDGTVLSSTPSTAVTASGTVTAALATQAKNIILAGPASGATSVAPTFRASGQCRHAHIGRGLWHGDIGFLDRRWHDLHSQR